MGVGVAPRGDQWLRVSPGQLLAVASSRRPGNAAGGGFRRTWLAVSGKTLRMRYVELRRHTDNDGDQLSAQGVLDAEAIGRTGLHPPYAAFVSTGAARATPMLQILR